VADRRVTIEAVLTDLVSNPLGTISRGFADFGRRLDAIGSRLSPVTGGLTSLVTGLLSLRGAQSAISAAEAQVQAEARLTRALQGRTEILKEIQETASRIQSITGEDDDRLLGLAARLINAGLAAERVPRALQAAVGTARELDIPIEQIIQAISAFQVNQAGLLTRNLPALKALQAEGRLTADGIDFLFDRFGRLDEIETTQFDRINARIADLGDESERVGLVLARLKERAIELAIEGLRKLADAASSPAFAAFLSILLQIAPAIAAFVGGLAAIATAKVAIGFLLAPLGLVLSVLGKIIALLGIPFLGPLLLILGTVGAISAAFGKYPALLEAITGKAKQLAAPFADSFARIREAFDALKDGRITTEDFFRVVQSKVRVLGIRLRSNIIDPVTLFLQTIKDDAPGVFALLAKVASVPFKSLDSMGDSVEKVLAEGGVPGAVAPPAEPARERATVENLARRIADARAKAEEEIRAEQAKTQTAFEAALDRGTEKAREEAEKRIEIERKAGEKILADFEALQARTARAGAVETSLLDIDGLEGLTTERVRELLESVSEAQREALSGILTRRIKEDLEAGRTSVAEFARLQEAIAVEPIRRQVDAETRIVETEREKRREIETTARKIEETIRLRQRELEETRELTVDQGAIQRAILEAETLRVEVPVDLQVGDAIDGLEKALLQADVGKGVADSITRAIADIRERIDLGLVTAPEDAAALNEQLGALEEIVRRKEGARATDEDVLRLTKELAKLEEERKGALANLFASGRREEESLERRVELSLQLVDAEGKLREERLKLLDAAEKEAEAARGALEERIQALDELQELGGVSAEDLFEERNRAIDSFIAKVDDLRDRLAQAVELDPRLAESASAVGEALDAATEKAEGFRKSLEEIEGGRAQRIRESVQGFEAIPSELARELDNLRRLETEGILSADATAARAQRTIALTFSTLDQIEGRVRAAIAADESLRDDLEDVLDKIRLIRAEVQTIEEDDFFGGLAAGAKGVAGQFDSLRESGRALGGALVTNLSEGLIDVFVRGQKSFEEFLQSFLEGIAVMIARILLLKAISAGLGAFGLNEGGAVPASVAGLNRGGLVPRRRFREGGAVQPAPDGPVVRVLRFAEGGLAPVFRAAAAGILLASMAGSSIAAPASPVAAYRKGGPVEPADVFFGAASRAGDALAAARPKRFAPGGHVPGPLVERDVVPALLTPGEFVQPTSPVRKYGLRAMEAIRRELIPAGALHELVAESAAGVVKSAEPRFQAGGAVESIQAGGRAAGAGPGMTPAFVVSSENELERLLRGGRPAVLRFLAQNAEAVRSVLSSEGG